MKKGQQDGHWQWDMAAAFGPGRVDEEEEPDAGAWSDLPSSWGNLEPQRAVWVEPCSRNKAEDVRALLQQGAFGLEDTWKGHPLSMVGFDGEVVVWY